MLEPLLVVGRMVPVAVHQELASLNTDGLDAAYTAAPAILVSHGAEDAPIKPSMAERMRRVSPASRLSLYPHAGHSPFFENAPRFNAELGAHVTSVQ